MTPPIPRRFPVIEVGRLPVCGYCRRDYARLVGPLLGRRAVSLQACPACALRLLDLPRARAFAPRVEPGPFIGFYGQEALR